MNGTLVSIVDPVPRARDGSVQDPPDGKIRVLIIATGKEASVPLENLEKAEDDAGEDDAPDLSWLAEGVKATLVGLDKAPHLNGELVSILDPVPRPKDGKIRVLIIAQDKEANVPLENLEKAEDDAGGH